jgi:hypothetical protein
LLVHFLCTLGDVVSDSSHALWSPFRPCTELGHWWPTPGR